jgi:hypothetical protein
VESWWTIIGGLLAFPVLLAANAFFVAAEFALVAVRKTRMQEMEERGIRGASVVILAIEHLDRYIAATQLGITLASLGLGLVVEKGLAGALVYAFSGLPQRLPFWPAIRSPPRFPSASSHSFTSSWANFFRKPLPYNPPIACRSGLSRRCGSSK